MNDFLAKNPPQMFDLFLNSCAIDQKNSVVADLCSEPSSAIGHPFAIRLYVKSFARILKSLAFVRSASLRQYLAELKDGSLRNEFEFFAKSRFPGGNWS